MGEEAEKRWGDFVKKELCRSFRKIGLEKLNAYNIDYVRRMKHFKA